MQSKYHLVCLNKTANATESIDIAYNASNESFVQNIVSDIPRITDDIGSFYSCNIQPKISIFVYPDLASMSEAFGRTLMSDQWCFVPVTGENSLITFTSKVNSDSLPQVLIHEFSHVYFSCITGNVDLGNYRQSIPLWLDEGIALCLDSKYRHNFDQTLKKRLDALKSKEDPYFPKLMDLYTYFNRLDKGEFGKKAMKAYSFSYFCVKELMGRFGEKHLVDFINKPDLASDFNQLFEDHFGCSLPIFNMKMTKIYS